MMEMGEHRELSRYDWVKSIKMCKQLCSGGHAGILCGHQKRSMGPVLVDHF